MNVQQEILAQLSGIASRLRVLRRLVAVVAWVVAAIVIAYVGFLTVQSIMFLTTGQIVEFP